MDRVTIEYGQSPLVTDLLQAQQNTMIALGQIISAFVGVGTYVDGFTLTPSSPASLEAVLSAGQVFQQESLEATAWSSLPANSSLIMKQGISLAANTLTFAPPTATGYEQYALVEVQYQDVDGGNVVRPYYNASNPAIALNGPGNAGTADSTVRLGAVAIQIKYGAAAAAGSAVPPTPDAGWAGLYVVTLTAGQTTITSGGIAPYAGAPFISPKLGGVAGAVQAGGWTYAGTSTDSGNNFSVALTPPPASFPVGMQISATMNTPPSGPANLIVNGTGFPIVRRGGAALQGNEWNGNDIVVFELRGSTAQLTSLTVNDITIPTTETLSAGEGISVGGSVISLDFEGLTAATPAASDLFSFFQESSGHHRQDTFSALTAAVLAASPLKGEVLVSASGVFTVPAGVYSIKARVWGGGGGGAGTFYGAGGQAGGYGEGCYAVTPGQTINVTIGAGGGTSGAGGTSSLGSFITAVGGSPGGGTSGGTVSGAAYAVNGPGGQTGINDAYVTMSGTPGAGYGAQVGQESDALAIYVVGAGSGGGPTSGGQAGQVIIEY